MNDPIADDGAGQRDAGSAERETGHVGWRDTFGLRPIRPALAEFRRVLTGNPYLPPSQWDVSSLKIFKPRISLATWLRRKRADGRVPIYNFFNRVQAPRDEGYSVKVSFARDFRGGRFTYDGHMGTDFAVPVGTPVIAAAPGVVLRVHNDMGSGGLKVCIDHGQGLFTTSSHLSRALVREGERVDRGRCVGLSGASGVEFVLCFPWVSPHVHYNTWLNGDPTDPFALPGSNEDSLWRSHNDPVPFDGTPDPTDESFEPSPWDPDGVHAAIEACRDPEARRVARSFDTLPRRAAEILILRNYRPAMFDAFPPLYPRAWPRRPVLDLPFRNTDFRGVALPAD